MSEQGQTRAIDQIRQKAAPVRSITVPEWGLTFYFNKLTTADVEFANEREPKNAQERNLLLLIHKARNEDGTPMFASGDLHYLREEADWFLLSKVVTFMYEVSVGLSLSEAKEKIETDPPSASV